MKSPPPIQQAARERHQANRYPGDLAADLGLSETSAASPWAWRSLALAASVVIAASALWWLNSAPPTEVGPEPGPIVVDAPPRPPVATTQSADPATIGVRLTEVPTLRLSRVTDRPSRYAPPSSPASFKPRSTPKRFPSVDFKRPKPNPPSSRRPSHEHAPDEIV
ncbi:hypothetical protein [Algisphaera agarilytica]|uniref:Uncharacterized protein n=1 Tax=Algisphaera agarilytica TaxID=1385975 RepID=A0A7X0H8K4_9BACT|nr:hypothetical protein [Algisphaera agarilytica]MBB6431113.1 hypothetical protein [Algisphaera agarilytica]